MKNKVEIRKTCFFMLKKIQEHPSRVGPILQEIPTSLISDQYTEYANVNFEFFTTASKHILLNCSDKRLTKLLLRLSWK